MFIDIHVHAYRKPNALFTGVMNAEQLIEMMDKLGVEKSIVLPIVSPEIYLPQTNEEVLDMAEKYPDRIVPFCNIDPRAYSNSPDAPLEKLLQYYKDKGCKGIGEVMPNLELMDPKVQNLFRAAEVVDMPLIFDGSDSKSCDFGIYDDPGLPQLEHTLQRFPNLKIFGHGPVFWSEIARLATPGERGYIYTIGRVPPRQVGYTPKGRIEEEGVVPILFRRYPNLYGDLSDGTAYNAFARDDEYGPKFMTEFQDRLMYGSDAVYPRSTDRMINLLLDWREKGKISETVFNKIARDNAKRI
ncbi:MAG: amidohydrolase family protein, partial [Clostridia bacterium]|nr:amidohydrolase family protein [Clostridia bacterium]